MEFRVLGPLVASQDGRRVDLGTRRRERCLLGVLLLEPGQSFTLDRLVDLLWDGDPPERARSTISSHISRLRGRVDPDRDGRSGVRLVARGDGYLVDVAPERVDVHRFTALADSGAALADPAERARVFRAALALWRGPLLADVATSRLRERLGARLEELRLDTLEAALEAEVASGEYAHAAAELADLVEKYPNRERLLSSYMLALYRCGRQMDALDAYGRARDRRIDGFGLDLGAEIQALHVAILRDDPRLEPMRRPVVSAAVGPPRPAQLPTPPRHFTGRTGALAELDAQLAGQDGMTSVVISAIAGTAGVGKTALALHWAARVRDRFPDGQLYLNLQGFGVAAPLPPMKALTQLLRGLGVPAERVPADPDEASAVYRTLLADRRMLVLLDNAHTVEQVRPLLPGSPSCLVIVTSRNRLGGLVAFEGAYRLTLEPLPADEAEALLRAVLGSRRVDAEPKAAGTLTEVCGRLPLALRIAAANLNEEPLRPIGDYLRELDADRLAALSLGDDPAAAVRIALDASYARLTPPARRVFRLLGLVPGVDIGVAAAGALTGTTAEEARRQVEALVDAHLVDQSQPGRYFMHDLIRAYATERARVDEPAGDRSVAVARLYDWYVAVVDAVSRLAAPHRQRPALTLRHPPVELPFPEAPDDALTFLDLERPNLPAVTRGALDGGDHRTAAWLAHLLGGYFQLRGDGPDSLAVYQDGLAAAGRLGDSRMEAMLHNSLGISLGVLRRFPEATEHLRHALRLAESTGDRGMQARVLSNLGKAHTDQAQLRQALGALERSLEIRQADGMTDGIGRLLNNIGYAHFRAGDYRRALDHFMRALELQREVGDRSGEGNTLDSIGEVYAEQGDDDTALTYFEHAMVALRETGSREAEGTTLANLAAIHVRRGAADLAVDLLRQAAELYRSVDDHHRESISRRRLGEAHLARGDLGAAGSELRSALALRAPVYDPVEEARTHRVLGDIEFRAGRVDQARQHWRAALDGYLRGDARGEADALRARLDG